MGISRRKFHHLLARLPEISMVSEKGVVGVEYNEQNLEGVMGVGYLRMYRINLRTSPPIFFSRTIGKNKGAEGGVVHGFIRFVYVRGSVRHVLKHKLKGTVRISWQDPYVCLEYTITKFRIRTYTATSTSSHAALLNAGNASPHRLLLSISKPTSKTTGRRNLASYFIDIEERRMPGENIGDIEERRMPGENIGGDYVVETTSVNISDKCIEDFVKNWRSEF